MPSQPGFDYQSEAGAVAAGLQFRVPAPLTAAAAAVQQQQQQEQQQQQQEQQQQQQQEQQQQQQQELWIHTRDYCNGGPLFLTRGGEHELRDVPGVDILARYTDAPHRFPSPGQPTRQGAANWAPAAAVRCKVGAGVAVLCGTHPELHPEWLSSCGDVTPEAPPRDRCRDGAAGTAAVLSSEALPPVLGEDPLPGAAVSPTTQTGRAAGAAAVAGESDAQLAAHTQALQAQLAGCQSARELFLGCLLYEALQRH
jgi:Biotin-protein ligase, N terminal/Protein of unknown function (DUF2722)